MSGATEAMRPDRLPELLGTSQPVGATGAAEAARPVTVAQMADAEGRVETSGAAGAMGWAGDGVREAAPSLDIGEPTPGPERASVAEVGGSRKVEVDAWGVEDDFFKEGDPWEDMTVTDQALSRAWGGEAAWALGGSKAGAPGVEPARGRREGASRWAGEEGGHRPVLRRASVGGGDEEDDMWDILDEMGLEESGGGRGMWERSGRLGHRQPLHFVHG